MANHKSAIKRIRSSEPTKQQTKYQHQIARTAIKQHFYNTKMKDPEQ